MRGAVKAAQDPKSVRLIARLNACVAADGRAARDVVRPSAARLLGRRSLRIAEAEGPGCRSEIIATIGPTIRRV